MHAFPALTRRAPFGAVAGRLLTAPHQGIVRSAFSGQANAILAAPALDARSLGAVRISDRGRHPRACQAVRLGKGLVVANLHASAAVADAEIGRALVWLEDLVKPDAPLVLAGDFNSRPELPGFSPPGPGIDHVLVRGAQASLLRTWPEERRRQNGVLLSDHAPVELTIP